MKNKLEVITYTLPMYWAPALINDDYSGLTDAEEKEINTFLEKNNLPAPVSCTEEPFFTWRNDANSLGCDCLEFSFLVETK